MIDESMISGNISGWAQVQLIENGCDLLNPMSLPFLLWCRLIVV